MTENVKKFLEAVSKNDELRARVSSMTKEDLLAMAKELGTELNEADFNTPAGEMNDTELEAVTGGGECYCAVGGGGTKNGSNDPCGCVLYGMGVYKKDGVLVDFRCECFGYGNGTEGPA